MAGRFVDRYLVARVVTGAPLVCERSFEHQDEAYDYADNIPEAVVIAVKLLRVGYESPEDRYEAVAYVPDAVDLGTIDPNVPPGRASRQEQVEDDIRERNRERERTRTAVNEQRADTGATPPGQGPRVVSHTTTPVNETRRPNTPQPNEGKTAVRSEQDKKEETANAGRKQANQKAQS